MRDSSRNSEWIAIAIGLGVMMLMGILLLISADAHRSCEYRLPSNTDPSPGLMHHANELQCQMP